MTTEQLGRLVPTLVLFRFARSSSILPEYAPSLLDRAPEP